MHSYVKQLITPHFDQLVSEFLSALSAFQDRNYHSQKEKGVKIKKRYREIAQSTLPSHSRFVSGLNEAKRAVLSRKAKCLIVAANLQPSGPEGRLHA